MSEDVNTVENFYGVYLLYCTNPKYLGRTYIGYTVDPNRRIKQHNRGKTAGGAWKTSNKGPWSMVMIIHGFPNDIAALRFEWAWQHPLRSRRLNHVPKKKCNENRYDYCLRVLSEMLQVGPWKRLPLTVRWLEQQYARNFPPNKIPPVHIPICYGLVTSKKLPKLKEIVDAISENEPTPTCGICKKVIEGEYIPIEGACPCCRKNYLWGDVIRKYKGCYGNLQLNLTPQMGNDFYSSDSE